MRDLLTTPAAWLGGAAIVALARLWVWAMPEPADPTPPAERVHGDAPGWPTDVPEFEPGQYGPGRHGPGRINPGRENL